MMSSNGGVQMQYSHGMAMDGFSDNTTLTNEDIAEILSSPDSVFMADNGGFDQNNSLQKPVRKRSRASKHTPTTFLIAKASDFRGIVQQLTGRQSANSFKGPINLNFGAAEDEKTVTDAVSTISVLEFNLYNKKTRVKNQQDRQHQQHQQQVQQQHDLEDEMKRYEEQESSSSGGDAFVSAFPSPGPCSMTMDDLDMENIFMQYGEYSLDGILADEVIVDGIYSSGYGLADESILFCGY